MVGMTVALLATLTTVLSTSSPSQFGFLDLEELENLQYSISIEATPIRMGDPLPKKAPQGMGSALGQILGVNSLDSLVSFSTFLYYNISFIFVNLATLKAYHHERRTKIDRQRFIFPFTSRCLAAPV